MSEKKRINTKKKGDRKESEIKKVYESLGFDVELPTRTRFNPFKDFYHCWDLMAIRHGEITFIQVKSSKTNDMFPITKAIDKSKDFIKKHGKRNNYMMYLVLPKNRGSEKYSNYRIWEYVSDKEEWKEFDDLDKKIYFNKVMVNYL